MNDPTGNRKNDENGDEWFEVESDEGLIWLPVHPDIVYSRTGEWKGWKDFLGAEVDIEGN